METISQVNELQVFFRFFLVLLNNHLGFCIVFDLIAGTSSVYLIAEKSFQ